MLLCTADLASHLNDPAWVIFDCRHDLVDHAKGDRLYREGEQSGTVMCIPLHPYLVGQPYRMEAFEEALDYITRHDKVWLATGREIAQYFNEHYYDAFAAASQPIGAL